jgi:hypothetical protein
MPIPKDINLYNLVKKKANIIYSKPSAYKSMYIQKEYKKNNGSYEDDGKEPKLKRWMSEEWMNINPLIGEDADVYPVFRPTHKVNSSTPILYQNIPLSDLKKQFALKQKYKGNQNLPPFKQIAVHNGGKLSVSTFKNLLKSSYKPQDEVDGFIQDKNLSSKTSKVYVNPLTNQTVVAHQGTSGFSDWLNNAVYAVGGQTLYKMTPRYKEAEKVQKEAEKKYGSKNITTIGHSQAGLQAELLGGNTNEILTLNKATRPFSNTKKENQYDIQSGGDYVSALNPFQPKNYNEIIIPSQTSNPLTEHDITILERLEGDRMIGR